MGRQPQVVVRMLQAPAYEPLSPTAAVVSPPLSPMDLPVKTSPVTGHPQPLAALDRVPQSKAPDIRRLADLDKAGAPAIRSPEVRTGKRDEWCAVADCTTCCCFLSLAHG